LQFKTNTKIQSLNKIISIFLRLADSERQATPPLNIRNLSEEIILDTKFWPHCNALVDWLTSQSIDYFGSLLFVGLAIELHMLHIAHHNKTTAR